MLDIKQHLNTDNTESIFWLACLQLDAAKTIIEFVSNENILMNDAPLDPTSLGSTFAENLSSAVTAPLNGIIYSGNVDRRSTMTAISIVKRHLADDAVVILDNADVMSVYEGIRDSLLADPGLRFESLHIETDDTRPGRGLAFLTWNKNRTTPQVQSTIPANKNRTKDYTFRTADEVVQADQALEIVKTALAQWEATDEGQAKANLDTMEKEFPDQASPTGYWHEETEQDFVDFFTWGHDHNFGFGQKRNGAMSTRHIEIVSECIQYGLLPPELSGQKVLNVGCWTGGDLLALAGMGGSLEAIEEHKTSAAAAKKLCEIVGAEIPISSTSLYQENQNWKQTFDIVYISGVIYHVTDPLLALRICFSYLKPGGSIIVETKASSLDGSYCEYAGTLEKGWNWYAPTRDAFGRWLVDAGFPADSVSLRVRQNGRLLAGATKSDCVRLPEKSGFSRPASWLEDVQ